MAVFWKSWNLENLYLGDTGWISAVFLVDKSMV